MAKSLSEFTSCGLTLGSLSSNTDATLVIIASVIIFVVLLVVAYSIYRQQRESSMLATKLCICCKVSYRKRRGSSEEWSKGNDMLHFVRSVSTANHLSKGALNDKLMQIDSIK